MSLVLRVLPILIVLALIAVIVWKLYKGYFLDLFKAQERAAQEKIQKQREAIRQVQEVKAEWLAYELSPNAVFELPSLMDVKVPEVSKFYRELRYFDGEHPNVERKALDAPVSVQFIADAERLAKAFRDAQRRAQELDNGKGEPT